MVSAFLFALCSVTVPLPFDDLLREELINQVHVVRLKLFDRRDIVALAVKVIRVESLYGLEHSVVFLAHKLTIGALSVPRIKRVIANHGESLIRQSRLILNHVIEIFVVAPAEHDVVKAAPGRVYAELGVVDGILAIGVGLKSLGQNDALIESTANRESVSNYIPLTLGLKLGKEKHQLTQVMDETGQLHPTRLAVAANSLRRLEEMLNLREGGIGVGLIDQSVELLDSLPDGHFWSNSGSAVETVASSQVISYSLLLVLLSIEVLDAIAGVFILTELRLVLLAVKLGLGVVFDAVHIIDGIGQALKDLAVMGGRWKFDDG